MAVTKSFGRDLAKLDDLDGKGPGPVLEFVRGHAPGKSQGDPVDFMKKRRALSSSCHGEPAKISTLTILNKGIICSHDGSYCVGFGAILIGALVNYQLTIQSAIAQSTIQSAIRNPQSAMTKWRTLFDGTSLDAWRGYKGAAIPDGWHIDHGTLAKDARVADIVSKDEFGDFELEIDWKIGEAGNSGIFYRGTEEIRAHLLERAGIPAARRHQGRGQQDAPHLRRRGVRGCIRRLPDI